MEDHPVPEQSGSGRSSRILVIGMGNEDRGDDAAGIAVVRLLKQRDLPEDVTVREVNDPSGLFHLLQGAATIILVDAVRSGDAAGTIHRIDVSPPLAGGEKGEGGALSHTLGLWDVLAVAREAGNLPERLVVYGIEAAGFERGAPLSSNVRESIARAADRILAEIARR
jgi:hydrogenase maturation protease